MQVLPPYSPVIADYLSFDATSVVTITNTSNVSYDEYLDAPYLISPICGDSVAQTYPQTVIFSWITPPVLYLLHNINLN
ncbi:MAG: hypothetical protein IPL12_07260 [Bacteroidetes bacterium]|nr:hypothetical protein [Bacteroidota bacterium]